MPEIGDIAKGLAIGKNRNVAFVWVKCPTCVFTRWVEYFSFLRTNGQCRTCFGLTQRNRPRVSVRGDKNASWKGGRLLLKSGYIRVSVYPEDPYYLMSKKNKGCCNGTILEHRLIMARHLKRCLEPWEVVHHKNSNRSDNRIENLELLGSRQEHAPSILIQQEVNKLRLRVEELEKELLLLKSK